MLGCEVTDVGKYCHCTGKKKRAAAYPGAQKYTTAGGAEKNKFHRSVLNQVEQAVKKRGRSKQVPKRIHTAVRRSLKTETKTHCRGSQYQGNEFVIDIKQIKGDTEKPKCKEYRCKQ